MPKTICFPDDTKRAGIKITWTKTAKTLTISGWYDSCVDIKSTRISLGEFFRRLGITEKNCLEGFNGGLWKIASKEEL